MCAGSLFDAVGYGTLLAAALHVVHVDGSRALTEIRHHTSLCQTTEEDTGTQVAVFCKYMCEYKRTKEKPNVIIYTIEGYKNIFLKYLEFSLTLLLLLLTVYDTVSISVTVYLKPRLG